MINSNNSNTALLIIDMINHFQFEHGEQLFEHTNKILLPILHLKDQAKVKQMPIIYINDHYNLWQANFKKIIQVCETNVNKNYISQIAPDEEDYFLIKPKHSAFYGTALNTLLYHLHIRSLIITGIAGNICVLFTANDAYMRDYQLYCPKDCIASADKQDNHYALTMMSHVLKANTSTSTDIALF
ncbi:MULTISPECIES: isochorismatase family cysteine hydrolase [Bacillus]|uniref:isochorismatase family cysteine hydrolase n=1 Tax=Bacillus TaxID=1386 RepID=UPI0002DA71EF|nr:MULTISPECIES: isochorismatase family cysteine hydrolase [Bacillus]